MPGRAVPSTIETSWTKRSPSFLRVSVTAARKPGPVISPTSPTWPPDFAVERRLVEDERALFARLEEFDFDPVLDDRPDHALGGLGLVAEEVGRADPLA